MAADVDCEAATRKPRVLVVAGASYVGQFLLQRLMQTTRIEVHLTYRSCEAPGELSKLPAHHLDVTDAEEVAAVLQKVDPDIVVNCAVLPLGQCQRDPTMATAVNCPRHLVECLAKLVSGAVRERLFVHFSTDLVFDGDPAKLYTEDTPLEPVNIYGRSKADMDEFLLGSLPPPHTVILRPTNVIGPRPPFGGAGATKFLQWLDARLCTEETTKLFSDERRNYVWVTDLVDVTLKLIDDFGQHAGGSLPARLLHCGGPEELSRVDVATRLATAKGHALTFRGDDGNDQDKIVPTPRAQVDLGYASPLVVKMHSGLVQAYLGRAMLAVGDAMKAHCSAL